MPTRWWQRLFSRSSHEVPVRERAPVPVDSAPSDVALAEPELIPAADTTPAEPDVDSTAVEIFPARTAADPRPPRARVSEPLVASSASLGRSMASRVRMLLDAADGEARHSDGPALVEMLLEGGNRLVSHPPQDALRALALIGDPRSSADQVAVLFRHDVRLTQVPLALANSTFLRAGDEPVTSLTDAVRRVGTQVLQSLFMAHTMERVLCRPGGPFEGLASQVQSHMQGTAPIAHGIAPAFGAPPDVAFACALLHDAGKLVIFDHADALRREQGRDLRIPASFFRQTLYHLHEPVGGLAMLRWGMGGEIAHGVGEHHRRPAPANSDPLTEAVCVAEAVELARSRHAALDWGALWDQGGITADRGEVGELLAGLDE